MKQQLITLAVLAGLVVTTGQTNAQHYPTGAEGIKGASLPPAGIYLRDYNIGYFADKFEGVPAAADFDLSAYINAPRLIWMTDWTIAGATYGMDIIVPFGYQHVSMRTPLGKYDKSTFGLADIQIEPLLLAWHFDKFDIGAGYAVWAPTGDFDKNHPERLGKGYWGHMLTLGATAFFDEEKTWSLSALNRYEINHEQRQTHVTPGNVYTVELGLGKTLAKVWEVGVSGYWQQQTTSNHGKNASDGKTAIFGIGPEVCYAWPDLMLGASLRYAHEFAANNRPEGEALSLTITKRF